jgi:protease I
MADASDAKILIIATHGFEQSELFVPLAKLREAGADVKVASLQMGEIKGWDHKDWGKSTKVDLLVDDAKVADYDALVLPGGQMNPDLLRIEPKVIALVQAFASAGKPIAAICHAPWLLIEAGLVAGRKMTSYKSIRTDLKNAGAQVVDEAAAIDGQFITSRDPHDLDAFVAAIIGKLHSNLAKHTESAMT